MADDDAPKVRAVVDWPAVTEALQRLGDPQLVGYTVVTARNAIGNAVEGRVMHDRDLDTYLAQVDYTEELLARLDHANAALKVLRDMTASDPLYETFHGVAVRGLDPSDIEWPQGAQPVLGRLRKAAAIEQRNEAIGRELCALKGSPPAMLDLGPHWMRRGGEYRFGVRSPKDNAWSGNFAVSWGATVHPATRTWQAGLYNLHAEVFGGVPKFNPSNPFNAVEFDTFTEAVDACEAFAKAHLGWTPAADEGEG